MNILKIILTPFALALATSGAEPERLTKLRGSYEAAVEKAAEPLRRTYLTELEKLKADLIKSGKLEDAVVVDAEIKKLKPAATEPTIAAPSATKQEPPATKPASISASGGSLSVADERWVRPAGGWYEFYSDGTCRTAGKGVPVEKAHVGKWTELKLRVIKIEMGDAVLHLNLTSAEAGKMTGPDGSEIGFRFEKKVTK